MHKHLTYLTLLLTICSLNTSFGQNTTVSGSIQTTEGEYLPGVYVQLGKKIASVTNENGRYIFDNLEPGKHIITASITGYQALQKEILIKQGEVLNINLILLEDITHLSEVTVHGKTESQELRESTANVTVLEAKKLYAQSNSSSDVIKQISGVNVRQTGGLGSDAEVYINGMSGKQVKFFLDGIPLSYFGAGFGLNALPLNIMEQIEVYKGVVPVHLGADALGGAINIVPRKAYNSYLDASYSFGSFNSHKSNLNAQVVNEEKKIFVGINSFYNHSDNDYKVDVEIPNKFGNPEPVNARRFHDKFTNHLLNLYTGISDKGYADRLIVSARYSGLRNEIQHNAIMAQPYGEVVYDESTWGLSLEYEKMNILPKTNLKWYGGLNQIKGHFTDTTLNAYTWDGKVYDRRSNGGEISTSRNLLELNAKNKVSRLNINYEPWQNGHVILNIFSSWFKRTGKDPIAAEFYSQDYYTNPTVLIKNATGLAYEHTIGEKLTSYTALKHFAYAADGYSVQNMEFRPIKQRVAKLGYSQSLRYIFSSNLLVKASYEFATRLPDEIELFGDFTLIRPNPFLKAEQSHNANLGLQFHSKKISVDFNSFYRMTDNIIWLRTSQFFAQYQNLLKAAVKGADLEVQYSPFSFVKLKANATYQDIRNHSPKHVSGSVDNSYKRARLPNIPYLFGNGEVRYHKENFLNLKNSFSAWWSASYVHEFYLYWPEDGNKALKNIIPSQFIQNIGVSYTLAKNHLFVTLESTNILDQKAYDNFSVQRPGRAYYITLRTYLNTNN